MRGTLGAEIFSVGVGAQDVVFEPTIERCSVHTIGLLADLTEDFRRLYSRMKYGSYEAVLECAQLMASMVMDTYTVQDAIAKDETIILASSAYGSVPTAAHSLLKVVVEILQDCNVKVEVVKIDRAGDFSTTDYSNLKPKKREKKMLRRQVTVAEDVLTMLDQRTVVIIDDLYATGSHERSLKELIQSTNVAAICFCYLIEFTVDLASAHPQIEEVINSTAVSEMNDMLPFFNGAFPPVLNARLLKYILLTDPKVGSDKASALEELTGFLNQEHKCLYWLQN